MSKRKNKMETVIVDDVCVVSFKNTNWRKKANRKTKE